MLPVFSTTLDRIAARHPVTVFLRDDDAGELDDGLRRLVDLCGDVGAPLSLAIVPGWLTGEAGEYLLDARANALAELEFHQHGWRHVNHEPDVAPAEFGGARSFAEQLADIAAGQRRMNEVFGSAWFPAFTPPWHAANADTLRALSRSGYAAFSSSAAQVLALSGDAPELCKVPVTLDLEFEFQPAAKPQAVTTIRLLEHMAESHFAGILLHHKVMGPESFAYLKTLLTRLVKHQGVSFATLRSIATAPPPFRFEDPAARFQGTAIT